MKILTYITPTLNAVYNLYKLLKFTDDEIVVCYFHLPRRIASIGFAVKPNEEDADKMTDIVIWLKKNVRNFEYKFLSLDNYEPRWSGIPDLELINYYTVCKDWFDLIAMPHSAENIDIDWEDIRKAVNHIHLGNMVMSDRVAPEIVYPLLDQNEGFAHACRDLPNEILSIVNDKLTPIRLNMMLEGYITDDILEIEKSFRKGTNEYSDIEDDGNWFVDGHPIFGSFVNDFQFIRVHPYYRYLVEEV